MNYCKKLAISTLGLLIPVLLLPSSAQARAIQCFNIKGEPFVVQNKTITIINNSDKPIYPIINSSANEKNEWRMACERVNSPLYSQTREYRAYVNWPEGLGAGQSVTLTVPLYTALPAGSPDGQITWWNGSRLFISDVKSGLEEIYQEDSAHPLSNIPDNLACVPSPTGEHCDLKIFYNEKTDDKGNKSTRGLPETIPGQLSEFTFGASIFPEGPTRDRRVLIPDNVNYNISYVDHTYLPVAIAPKNNPYIGYTGSTMSIPEFHNKMKLFLENEGKGWPVFDLEKKFPGVIKIPGAYNVFALRNPAGEPVLTPYGEAVQKMQNIWAKCIPGEFSELGIKPPPCPPYMKENLQEIFNFFNTNKQRYTDNYNGPLNCANKDFPYPKEFGPIDMLAHIYGWVPFNQVCGAGKNDLNSPDPALENVTSEQIDAAKALHHDLQMKYINQLQYSYIYHPDGVLFNPYVKLIHGENFLNMDSYAFSIDDAVGFMSELGTGLNFTVGGSNGLDNKEKFQGGKFNATKFTFSQKEPGGFVVSLGSPYDEKWKGPILPLWASYGACVIPAGQNDCTVTDIVTIPPTIPPIPGFRIGTINYPVKVEFKDADGTKYSFVVTHDFASTTGTPENEKDGTITTYFDIVKDCKVNNQPNDVWCGLKAYTKEDPKERGKRSYISGPKPLKYILQDRQNLPK